jgi:hypothetical protein
MMKFGGFTRLALLSALKIIAAPAAQAQDGAQPNPPAEATKQEGIYRSKGEAVPKGYVIGRDLDAYISALPPDFGRSLATLGANDRWLDIGAGEGNAILDYMHGKNVSTPTLSSAKAHAVAISIEDRRTFDWHKTAAQLGINQIRYLYSKPLRAYSQQELGRFQIITDFLGGFSYTENLSGFMEKSLSLLQVNGSFYSVLQDVHSEAGSNKPHYAGSPFLTELINDDGSKTKVCTWLKSISCVKVTCELKPSWTPPVETYYVQKVCDNVTVPALTRVHFAAGTPPERRFRLTPSTQRRLVESTGVTQ